MVGSRKGTPIGMTNGRRGLLDAYKRRKEMIEKHLISLQFQRADLDKKILRLEKEIRETKHVNKNKHPSYKK